MVTTPEDLIGWAVNYYVKSFLERLQAVEMIDTNLYGRKDYTVDNVFFEDSL